MTQDFNAARSTVQVALAILERDGKYLFQLRDNIPGIVAPGQWALFGGHLEEDENPEAALRRELVEELEFTVGDVRFFGRFECDNVMRHIFVSNLHVPVSELVLNEGQDMRLLARAEILSGQVISQITGANHAVAPHILNIFREFLTSV